MVDFLTVTPNSTVSRLDIFDFSDSFDFQADVPPKINDLRNPGFGPWFAFRLSKGKRTGSRAWAHWTGEASCWVNFETTLANEPLLPRVMPLRTRNSWPPPRMELNWVLKVSPGVTSEGFLHSRSVTRVQEDAEDVVQETFQKAFVHLQKFEGKSSFSTWLTRIAINESLMSLRRRRALHESSAGTSPELRSGWYMTELTLDWQLSSPARQRAQLSPPPVSSFGSAR